MEMEERALNERPIRCVPYRNQGQFEVEGSKGAHTEDVNACTENATIAILQCYPHQEQ